MSDSTTDVLDRVDAGSIAQRLLQCRFGAAAHAVKTDAPNMFNKKLAGCFQIALLSPVHLPAHCMRMCETVYRCRNGVNPDR